MSALSTSPTVTGSAPAPLPGSGLRDSFVQLAVRERGFLAVLFAGFLLSGLTWNTPHVAMWVGFVFAGYAAVANDSIQTLGTWLASNRHVRWWMLWLFVGGIFLVTAGWSWATYDGDVSWQRLSTKGFATAPGSFSFLQVAAPLFLLILTRLRMPVSTTFLLLSSFATTPKGITSVLTKSLSGYAIAFGVALVSWLVVGRLLAGAVKRGPAHPAWRVGQWASTGFLWSVWLMQDAANVAVYLPRQLSLLEFSAFAGVFFFGLGLLMYLRGDRIQRVVTEKTEVVDVRHATVIDLVYGGVLYWFKVVSEVPMSTTWVFIGLLAGREIALHLRGGAEGRRSFGTIGRLIAKDVLFVAIGLAVSLIIAASVNPVLAQGFFGW